MTKEYNENLLDLEDDVDMEQDVAEPNSDGIKAILYSVEMMKDMSATASIKGISKQDVETVNRICVSMEEYGVEDSGAVLESYMFTSERSFNNTDYAVESFSNKIANFIKAAFKKIIDFITTVITWIKRYLMSERRMAVKTHIALESNKVIDKHYSELIPLINVDQKDKVLQMLREQLGEVDQMFVNSAQINKPTMYGYATVGHPTPYGKLIRVVNEFHINVDELVIEVENLAKFINEKGGDGNADSGFQSLAKKFDPNPIKLLELEPTYVPTSPNSFKIEEPNFVRNLEYKNVVPYEKSLEHYANMRKAIVELSTSNVDMGIEGLPEVIGSLGSSIDNVFKIVKDIYQFNEDKVNYLSKTYGVKRTIYPQLYSEIMKSNMEDSKKKRIESMKAKLESALRRIAL